MSISISLLPLISLFSQQAVPVIYPHTHKSDYICSRLSNLVNQNKINRQETPSPQLPKTHSADATCAISISDWSSYSESELVNKLKITTDYDCFRAFFVLDSPKVSRVLFSNENIQAVAKEMLSISISHDGTLNSGMYGLVIYLRTVLYQEFGQELVSLNTESKKLLFVAMESFADNEHLWNVDKTALSILNEYLILCDYTGLRHKDKILSVVKNGIKKLITEDNWKPIVSDMELTRQYGGTYNKILYLLFRGINTKDSDYISAIHRDTDLVRLLHLLSKDEELTANEGLKFIVDNAVVELTRMASSDVLRSDVLAHIADLTSFYPRLTLNWYLSVETINEIGNCGDYNLCEDLSAVRQEIKGVLLPNTWVFDDGKLEIRTGQTH